MYWSSNKDVMVNKFDLFTYSTRNGRSMEFARKGTRGVILFHFNIFKGARELEKYIFRLLKQ